MNRSRQYVLGGLLAVLVALSLVTLFEIVNVVVFAITVAYVLYPLRKWLASWSVSRRVASALTTSVAFLVVVVLLAPLAYAVYDRHEDLIASLDRIPERVELQLVETRLVIELAPYIEAVEGFVGDLAVSIAFAAPRLALELAVFTLLLYGILYRPGSIRQAMYRLVPRSYHDVLTRLHLRTAATLNTIYVVQATTAAATVVIAAVVFWLLGLSNVFWLALVAGLLQFVPIVGPSLLVIALAANEFLLGFTTRAVLVLVFGLIFVSFIPDAVIRTKLAGRSGEIAGSLYFVGFVGGILTMGAIGVIVGPLVIALLVEVVRLLSDTHSPLSTDSSESTPGSGPANASGGTAGEQKSP